MRDWAECFIMEHVDIAIVGGGVVGSAAAYYLKKHGFSGSIAIIEKDTTYQFGCTGRSLGGDHRCSLTQSPGECPGVVTHRDKTLVLDRVPG